MARFDVHRVAGQPGYLLDVQADHLAALPSRIVVRAPRCPRSATSIRCCGSTARMSR
jgi:hypothetical protein